MDQLDLVNNIDNEFHSIINNSFPNHFLRNWGSSGPRFEAQFASENRYFENTEYYYTGPLTFVHLTSYKNLFSILNSRKLRLYNLHNSNDKEEYEYSANLFSPSLEEIDHRKNHIYTFSFCSNADIDNNHIWKLYGNEFKGVGLVFEIINDPKTWDNFHISDIKYNTSESLKNYLGGVSALKEKYRGCSFYLELEKLMAFHKSQKWENEREIRILTYLPYTLPEERLKLINKELIISDRGIRFTDYIELDLGVDNNSSYIRNHSSNTNFDRTQVVAENYYKVRPQIKIRNIIFGQNCGMSPNEYIKIRPEIEQLIRFKFGYQVELSLNFQKPK